MTATTAPAPGTGAKTELTHREALWVVFGVLVPVLMASMDQTIVATALPTIGRELGRSPEDLQYLSWVVAAYLLTMTAATPLYGKFSDTRGRRLTLIIAIVIFMAGGIASALAQNLQWLVIARAVQGIGTGGLVSQAMTVLGDVAPPKQRARYYTYFSIIYTTAGAAGPAAGGFLSQYVHWSAVFWIAVPLGLASLLLALTLLRKLPRHDRPHRLDIVGAILLVAASSTLMFVLNAGGKSYSWTSPQVLLTLCVSLLAWAAFLLRLRTAPEPLIPLGILSNPIVRASTLANAIGWGSVIALNIYLPLYLQAVLGMSPATAGLNMMMLMVTVNLSALAGAQVAARATHYKTFPMSMLGLTLAAMLWLTWRVEHVGTLEFQIILAAIGIGFGPLAPVSTVATQNAVMLNQLGSAISLMSFTRSLFASMLIAGLGAIVLHKLGGDGGQPSASALAANREVATGAFRVLFAITTASFLVAFIAFWKIEERPLLNSNEGRTG